MKNFEHRVIVIASGMIVKTVDTIEDAIAWVSSKNIQHYEILPVALPRE
jgi:hypothetical protein